jgi:predicted RNase H-like nuclease (RuvC/YqgF family)
MTPEQIEEYKALLAAADGPDWAHDSELMDKAPIIINTLLFALEEAQLQLKETEDWEKDAYAWRDFCDERNNLDPNEFTEDNFVMMRQENQDLRQQIEPLRRNNQEWQTALLQTQQQSAKWEKAFDNADRQYLKQEKLAADLRRQLTGKTEELAEVQQQFAEEKKWRAVEHEVADGYHRELVEAQQTIARLREALNVSINKGAILEWLEAEIELSAGNDPVLKADRWVFRQVKKEIESGRLDAKPAIGETQP